MPERSRAPVHEKPAFLFPANGKRLFTRKVKRQKRAVSPRLFRFGKPLEHFLISVLDAAHVPTESVFV